MIGGPGRPRLKPMIRGEKDLAIWQRSKVYKSYAKERGVVQKFLEHIKSRRERPEKNLIKELEADEARFTMLMNPLI